jgi:hypothetical protein
MSEPVNKVLLALLLALKDLEASSLSDDEGAALRDVAAQLQLDLDNWKDYEPDLLKVIQANPSLNQLYQTAKSQLDALSSEIPSNLLPTEAEIDQVAPIPNRQPQTRAPLQVSPSDLKSNEITNMAIRVLATPNPVKTTKELSRLNRLNIS